MTMTRTPDAKLAHAYDEFARALIRTGAGPNVVKVVQGTADSYRPTTARKNERKACGITYHKTPRV